MKKNCKMCHSDFIGRIDKLFCSMFCKNFYHRKLHKVSHHATIHINNILLRNRSILLEIMGKHLVQKKLYRLFLDKKRFNYDYITSFHINNQGKTVHHVYDFSWMIFSDEEILIKRKKHQFKSLITQN